ncbi:hypothetical protein [Slackia faecicanis]|uniref:hypothetical protein n=1 Tax=Slackia faecicanis TaxID=255723 RepID=UPI001B87B971|nr:hypothetical protein [Slackia faecicanis]
MEDDSQRRGLSSIVRPEPAAMNGLGETTGGMESLRRGTIRRIAKVRGRYHIVTSLKYLVS